MHFVIMRILCVVYEVVEIRAGLTMVPNVQWHRAVRREVALRGTKN